MWDSTLQREIATLPLPGTATCLAAHPTRVIVAAGMPAGTSSSRSSDAPGWGLVRPGLRSQVVAHDDLGELGRERLFADPRVMAWSTLGDPI